MLADILGFLYTTLFFRAVLNVSVVEPPARLACEPAAALARWRPGFKRAAAVQSGLVITGVVSSIIAANNSHGFTGLPAGIVPATIVPFTFAVIMPANRKLLDRAVMVKHPALPC